ncbi:MraW methylase family-domain-containing protein [Polychytrium aggregatum]|uniref:MraW methylase family-domain-containing protein n=1 Tax=Polychytrium aggregatum TaxID=110093 RepID=UPI0022FEF455|nr:MraW methylase family-domain-containing protein [Polychytrium aggregatum]KAI9208628.1 MraW methylase family-domain-containing protein [Polychytrium aggregatum]
MLCGRAAVVGIHSLGCLGSMSRMGCLLRRHIHVSPGLHSLKSLLQPKPVQLKLESGLERSNGSDDNGPRRHVPVMLEEVVEYLQMKLDLETGALLDDAFNDPSTKRLFCDATFGEGHYTRKLLDTFNCDVVVVDQDPFAIERAKKLADEEPYRGRVVPIHGKFGDLKELMHRRLGSSMPCLDGIVFDVGVSSNQIDEPLRGFSFRTEGPLDMRMSSTGALEQPTIEPHVASEGLSALQVVNEFSQDQLAHIIKEYGEERFAHRVARFIINERTRKPITTTSQLASVVANAIVPRFKGKYDWSKHPATKTFQAIRIYVNDELNELRKGLKAAEELLKPGGHLVVVTFHSLEDRIVKEFIHTCAGGAHRLSQSEIRARRKTHHIESERDEEYAASAHYLVEDATRAARSGPKDMHLQSPPSFFKLTFRTVKPTSTEIESNSRSRSAKLRAAVRTLNSPMYGRRLG